MVPSPETVSSLVVKVVARLLVRPSRVLSRELYVALAWLVIILSVMMRSVSMIGRVSWMKVVGWVLCMVVGSVLVVEVIA